MTIIEPDFETRKKSGEQHQCFSRYIFGWERQYQSTLPGTLRQCADCGRWWYLYQSSRETRVWYKVRWYQKHYKNRIKGQS